jgi:hypothetical protein
MNTTNINNEVKQMSPIVLGNPVDIQLGVVSTKEKNYKFISKLICLCTFMQIFAFILMVIFDYHKDTLIIIGVLSSFIDIMIFIPFLMERNDLQYSKKVLKNLVKNQVTIHLREEKIDEAFRKAIRVYEYSKDKI